MPAFIMAVLMLLPPPASAQQAPEIDWQRCYGGSAFEEGHAVVQTSDGGYAIAGATETASGNWFFYVARTDNNGNLQWQRSLGGNGTDKAYAIRQTQDDGFIVVGQTSSYNGDVSSNNGGFDCWVVKLDAAGVIQWERSLGGPGGERGVDVLVTPAGEYVIAASTNAIGGDVSEHFGDLDYWIVKLLADGTLDWQRSFGGSGADRANAIISTSDGGYLVVGSTTSTDGHVTDPLGDWDMWVLKLDAVGDLQWQRTYGGSDGDGAGAVVLVSEGGYLVAGSTSSTDGDVSESFGNGDLWLVRIDAMGELLWARSYGGSSVEWSNGIVAVANGYVMAGSTDSSDGDITGFQGGFYDYWLIRVDLEGELIWQRCLGGPGDDRAGALDATADGGYIVAGLSSSNGGDVTSCFPGYDLWVVKLATDPTGIEEQGPLSALAVYPVPTAGELTLSADLASPGHVRVQLFGLAGQLHMQLYDAYRPAGRWTLERSLADLPSGVYMLRISVDGRMVTRRVVKL